jgi:hypothetical protein
MLTNIHSERIGDTMSWLDKIHGRIEQAHFDAAESIAAAEGDTYYVLTHGSTTTPVDQEALAAAMERRVEAEYNYELTGLLLEVWPFQ